MNSFIVLVCFISCQASTVKVETKVPAEIMEQPTPKKKFGDVVFDSKKDIVCTMPISAGVTDTLHYKGKVYGFCSSGCKEEFVKAPAKYLTQK